MMLVGDSWRVYDVVIENIGLVANYRNEFSGIIRKEKFSGLMARLRQKIA
jgi:phospholipid transport system substrate-binding protein